MVNLNRTSRLALLLCVALLVSLTTTGCFKASLVYDIDSQGQVAFQAKVLGAKLIQKQLDKQRRDFSKMDYLSVSEAREGNMRGYELRFTKALPLETCPETFGKRYGNCTVKRTANWLRDVYQVNLTVPGFKDLPIPTSQLRQFKDLPILIDLTVNLPEAPSSSNAQKTENEGKRLYWNVTSCVFGEDNNVQLTFSIWNRQRVYIAIAVGGTLLFLLIFIPILVKLNRLNNAASSEAGEPEAYSG